MNAATVAQLGKRIVELLRISEGGCVEIAQTRDGRLIIAKLEPNQT